jgi:hypothetical protein
VLVYAVAIVAALAIPLLTRGSYKRLVSTEWKLGWLLFAGLGIQIALEYVTIPKEHWHDLGFGLLVASYVLILGFLFRNLVHKGIGIVIVGIMCNFVVIAANQGMPFKVPAAWAHESWVQPSVKHHPQVSSDKIVFLSDQIVLKSPWDTALSIGDIILTIGLLDVAYNASRKPKKRRVIDLTNDDKTSAPPAGDQDALLNRSPSTRSNATITRLS